MREERNIDGVTVQVESSRASADPLNQHIRVHMDDGVDGSEAYGYVNIDSLQDADWLISRLTVARDSVWPTETNPDAPNQLALIPGLMSAQRDEDLADLRRFAKFVHQAAQERWEHERKLNAAHHDIAYAVTAVMGDPGSSVKRAWLSHALVLLKSVTESMQVERAFDEYQREAAKVAVAMEGSE